MRMCACVYVYAWVDVLQSETFEKWIFLGLLKASATFKIETHF